MKPIPVLLTALFALVGQPGRAASTPAAIPITVSAAAPVTICVATPVAAPTAPLTPTPVAPRPDAAALFCPATAAATQSAIPSATHPAAQAGSTPPPASTSDTQIRTPFPPASMSDTAAVARTYAIDDVEVTARGRIRRLGRSVKNVIVSCGGPDIKIGDEMGVPCDARQRTLKLGTLRIWCHTRSLDSLVLRLHLYPLENGAVGERFAIAPIYLHIPTPTESGEARTGMKKWNDNTTTSQPVSFDLRPYDLHVTGEFLLAVECVNVRITRPDDTSQSWGLWFNARLLAPTYSRTAADPAWGVDKIGIGMSVEGVPASPGATALGAAS